MKLKHFAKAVCYSRINLIGSSITEESCEKEVEDSIENNLFETTTNEMNLYKDQFIYDLIKFETAGWYNVELIKKFTISNYEDDIEKSSYEFKIVCHEERLIEQPGYYFVKMHTKLNTTSVIILYIKYNDECE